jgi:predicted nuclease with TOPRIM domain|nr:MAG TPA: minor structural protein [Caudoviricetes sp.]
MKKEDFIALGLDEETAKKCAKASTDELATYVPKAQFDTVVTERDTANNTIKERDTQLETLRKSTGNVEELQEKIKTLQNENTQAAEKHAKEIKQLKIDSAVESALMAAGAKNMKAVRALLDIDAEKVKVKEDGSLDGLSLDEQIKKLQGAEDSKFMFKETKTKFKGANPNNPHIDDPTQKGVKDMTYEELCKYMEENPDANLE